MLRIHPVVEALPTASPARRAAVAASMKADRQLVPILLLDGMIWDGRARYEICREIGRDPWLVPLRGWGPIESYINCNMHRAGEPQSAERRALIDVLAAVFSADHQGAMAQRRDQWLRAARAEFQREYRIDRTPCAVCEKHAEFAHAHHLFPLALQYECGIDEPIHDVEWLCPVHHKHVHALLSGYLLGNRELDFLDSIPDELAGEWESIQRVSQAGIRLCCEALGGGTGTRGRFDPPFGLYIARHHQAMKLWEGPK